MPFIASAVVASLLAALAARAMPMLESRAPHFAEIIQPSEPLIVRNSTGGNTTFLLTYRNGVRRALNLCSSRFPLTCSLCNFRREPTKLLQM